MWSGGGVTGRLGLRVFFQGSENLLSPSSRRLSCKWFTRREFGPFCGSVSEPGGTFPTPGAAPHAPEFHFPSGVFHGSHSSLSLTLSVPQLFIAMAQTMPAPSDLKRQFISIVQDSPSQRCGQDTEGTACLCSVISGASAA